MFFHAANVRRLAARRLLPALGGLLAGLFLSPSHAAAATTAVVAPTNAASAATPRTTAAVAATTNAWPTAEFLVERVVERSAWNEAQQIRNRYSFTRRHITDELTDKGLLKDRKDRVYEATPIGGVSHSRLVLKDGQPLSAKEAKKETEKEQKAWEVSTTGLQQPITPDKGRSINHDLVHRFRFEVIGEETLRGRRSYVLTMEPKSRDLPVKQLQDNFFNKLAGKVWIDAVDFEVAKAEISLREKVPILLNLIGAMNKFTIHFRKQRLPEGVWLTDRSWVDLETRKLMLNSHVNHLLEWRDFKLVGPAPTNFVPAAVMPARAPAPTLTPAPPPTPAPANTLPPSSTKP